MVWWTSLRPGVAGGAGMGVRGAQDSTEVRESVELTCSSRATLPSRSDSGGSATVRLANKRWSELPAPSDESTSLAAVANQHSEVGS
eukprot:1174416-Pyramimonas_sp.AAC.2